MTKEKDYVYIFINQLFYGKIKWPSTENMCPKPIRLRIRLIDSKGKPSFLGGCTPERVSGYGSSATSEGYMYIMSLGLNPLYTLIDSITANPHTEELELVVRK